MQQLCLKNRDMINIEIKSWCRITNTKVLLNGEELEIPLRENTSWLTNIYKSQKIDYPKYFKMDTLSKAGFLASEIIMRSLNIDPLEPKPKWSIISMNSSSSLETDKNYQQTIQDTNNYFPSPSVFVYTLANIVTGEIAIRNKIMGETLFFVHKDFSPHHLYQYSIDALSNDSIENLLCGWVEDGDNNIDVLMFALKKNTKVNNFNIENIKTIY